MPNIHEVKISAKGIQKSLNKFTPERAISEYVWNGFDADATNVDINIAENELNSITKIVISDNGIGIDYQKLNEKFTNFFEELEKTYNSLKKKYR